jgi:NAD(P)H-nitrite reductase large subunit
VAKRRQVIVGSGAAALAALKQLRNAGCDDEVRVLTMESCAPYSPMSLPYLISGRVTESDIRMVPDDFFDRMNAIFMRDRKVVAVEPKGQRVVYEDGGTDRYDRLLLATGSEPILPPLLKDAGSRGFHIMDDYIALEGQLRERKRIMIVGAGLVAMELAAALAPQGHTVTVVAPRERILRAYFDQEAGQRIMNLFTAAGVSVNLKWGEAESAERHGDEVRVRFVEGRYVDAEIVLACLGVKARTAFLDGSGIAVNGGIAVDRQMRTSIPNIFAAGDVAEGHDFFSGRRKTSPILPSAAAQGKIAGDSMADRASEYEGSLPMNAFSFLGHFALSIGKAAASDVEAVVSSSPNGSYARLVFAGEVLIGASFLDVEVEAGVFQYLIRKKVPVGHYREMLIQRPREIGFWLMNEAERRETVSREE